MNNSFFTLAFTTFGKRVNNLVWLNQLKDDNLFSIYVFHQLDGYEQFDSQFSSHIRYFPVNSIGVSRNRNYALKNCFSEFIIFCDDDLFFDVSKLYEIQSFILNHLNHDIFFTILNDGNGKKIKGYKPKVNTQRDYISFWMPETIFKKSSIIKSQIQFDEMVGPGTSGVPLGEDTVFLIDCFNNNLKAIFTDIQLFTHQSEDHSANRIPEDLLFKYRCILFSKKLGRFTLLKIIIKNLVLNLTWIRHPKTVIMRWIGFGKFLKTLKFF